jgi:hypothetical protein
MVFLGLRNNRLSSPCKVFPSFQAQGQEARRTLELIAELIDLFRRALIIDQECSRLNGTAPAGNSRRLRGVELTARGLEGFSFSKPALTEAVKLPEWEDTGRLAWPPPKTPLAALVAAAMTPPHDPRFTADWRCAPAGHGAAGGGRGALG